MSYLSPINTRIEPILEAAKSAICLYDNDYNPITSRNPRCRYCSFIRKIKNLRELCDECDCAALTSDADHEYDCPFGLKEAVVHLPLKNGMMHAIMGKHSHECRRTVERKSVSHYRWNGNAIHHSSLR